MIRVLRDPRGALCAAIILAWVILALLAPELAPFDPLETVARARQPPGPVHWFGTDQLGRDVLSRLLFGGRISLTLGVAGVAAGAVPGIALGVLAGTVGGALDTAIMRLIDALLAFPGVLLALVVIAALGPGIGDVIIAVGVAAVPQYTRLARATVLGILALPYVEAARASGVGLARLMWHHILRNAQVPLIVLTSLQVGNAILVGSGLSFLGLGAQPPTSEWGLMCAEGRQVIDRAWWLSAVPGLAVMSVALAFNIGGDVVRAVMDTRARQ